MNILLYLLYYISVHLAWLYPFIILLLFSSSSSSSSSPFSLSSCCYYLYCWSHRESTVIMNYRVTDVLMTCKGFRLLRSESLGSSLNIFLYPTSSPSSLFLDHIFYTPHSVYLFNSVFQNTSQIHLFLIIFTTTLCQATVFPTLDTYSPIFTFAYPQFLTCKEIKIILSK